MTEQMPPEEPSAERAGADHPPAAPSEADLAKPMQFPDVQKHMPALKQLIEDHNTEAANAEASTPSTEADKATILVESSDGGEPKEVQVTGEQIDEIARDVNKGASY